MATRSSHLTLFSFKSLLIFVNEGSGVSLLAYALIWVYTLTKQNSTGRALFTLRNLDGSAATKYPYSYHQNSLELFLPRTGYIRQKDDLVPLTRQSIRKRKGKKKTNTSQ
jgi:hypothetical protein